MMSAALIHLEQAHCCRAATIGAAMSGGFATREAMCLMFAAAGERSLPICADGFKVNARLFPVSLISSRTTWRMISASC